MNTKKFSEAMNELDNKYVEKAINYQAKKRRISWVKWGAIAACFLMIISLSAMPLLNPDSPSKYQSMLVLTAYAADGTATELSVLSSVINSGSPAGNIFGNEFPLFSIYVSPAEQYDTNGKYDLFYEYDIEITYNGKVVSGKDEHIIVGYSVYADGYDGESQYLIMGWFEETTDIQILLKEKDTGKIVETLNVNVSYSEEEKAYQLILTNIDSEIRK